MVNFFAHSYQDLPGYPCVWSSPRMPGHEPEYRYTLWRVFAATPPRRIFCCIGLNPSTATEDENDPTITRVIGFAQREQCDALLMLNLFAFRATNPKVMKMALDPIGPENDGWLRRGTEVASVVLAAWGKDGEFMGRGAQVAAIIPDLYCLGKNRGGMPKHPLYVTKDKMLERF